jgi:hypothetical protein
VRPRSSRCACQPAPWKCNWARGRPRSSITRRVLSPSVASQASICASSSVSCRGEGRGGCANAVASTSSSPQTGRPSSAGTGRKQARVAPAISWPARSRGFFRRRGR